MTWIAAPASENGSEATTAALGKTCLAILSSANPIGMEILHSAFFATEQLSRTIAQPIVGIAAMLLAVCAGIEILIRSRMSSRDKQISEDAN